MNKTIYVVHETQGGIFHQAFESVTDAIAFGKQLESKNGFEYSVMRLPYQPTNSSGHHFLATNEEGETLGHFNTYKEADDCLRAYCLPYITNKMFVESKKHGIIRYYELYFYCDVSEIF